ncbi:hypothetical protein B0H15DRAFT_932398 [Mycena belliarum]|uniref:Uncharacterized protein n=1 Tax=Mycena belliarum TaxID=1033014 RepID=A0AAD6XP67_9AGAR|nr:hypothetical protein B0H15DRAFT_932398 [Mycena belliae]
MSLSNVFGVLEQALSAISATALATTRHAKLCVTAAHRHRRSLTSSPHLHSTALPPSPSSTAAQLAPLRSTLTPPRLAHRVAARFPSPPIPASPEPRLRVHAAPSNRVRGPLAAESASRRAPRRPNATSAHPRPARSPSSAPKSTLRPPPSVFRFTDVGPVDWFACGFARTQPRPVPAARHPAHLERRSRPPVPHPRARVNGTPAHPPPPSSRKSSALEPRTRHASASADVEFGLSGLMQPAARRGRSRVGSRKGCAPETAPRVPAFSGESRRRARRPAHLERRATRVYRVHHPAVAQVHAARIRGPTSVPPRVAFGVAGIGFRVSAARLRLARIAHRVTQRRAARAPSPTSRASAPILLEAPGIAPLARVPDPQRARLKPTAPSAPPHPAAASRRRVPQPAHHLHTYELPTPRNAQLAPADCPSHTPARESAAAAVSRTARVDIDGGIRLLQPAASAASCPCRTPRRSRLPVPHPRARIHCPRPRLLGLRGPTPISGAGLMQPAASAASCPCRTLRRSRLAVPDSRARDSTTPAPAFSACACRRRRRDRPVAARCVAFGLAWDRVGAACSSSRRASPPSLPTLVAAPAAPSISNAARAYSVLHPPRARTHRSRPLGPRSDSGCTGRCSPPRVGLESRGAARCVVHDAHPRRPAHLEHRVCCSAHLDRLAARVCRPRFPRARLHHPRPRLSRTARADVGIGLVQPAARWVGVAWGCVEAARSSQPPRVSVSRDPRTVSCRMQAFFHLAAWFLIRGLGGPGRGGFGAPRARTRSCRRAPRWPARASPRRAATLRAPHRADAEFGFRAWDLRRGSDSGGRVGAKFPPRTEPPFSRTQVSGALTALPVPRRADADLRCRAWDLRRGSDAESASARIVIHTLYDGERGSWVWILKREGLNCESRGSSWKFQETDLGVWSLGRLTQRDRCVEGIARKDSSAVDPINRSRTKYQVEPITLVRGRHYKHNVDKPKEVFTKAVRDVSGAKFRVHSVKREHTENMR